MFNIKKSQKKQNDKEEIQGQKSKKKSKKINVDEEILETQKSKKN